MEHLNFFIVFSYDRKTFENRKNKPLKVTSKCKFKFLDFTNITFEQKLLLKNAILNKKNYNNNTNKTLTSLYNQ